VLTRLERVARGARPEDLRTAFGVAHGRGPSWAGRPQDDEGQ
jgi:hypothetical protein